MIILLFTANVPGSRLCQPKLSLTSVAFAEEVAETGSRFQVPGSRFKVPGSRFQVPGSRYKHGTILFADLCFKA